MEGGKEGGKYAGVRQEGREGRMETRGEICREGGAWRGGEGRRERGGGATRPTKTFLGTLL